jgi:predicted enzyme related to lactoylglutathione lyase
MSETMNETAGKYGSSCRRRTPGARRSSTAAFHGWQFQPFDGQEYYVSYAAGGAIYPAPGQNGPAVYLGVSDVGAAAARVRELGGEAGGQQEIAGAGRYVPRADTEGNRVGLYQGGGSS